MSSSSSGSSRCCGSGDCWFLRAVFRKVADFITRPT